MKRYSFQTYKIIDGAPVWSAVPHHVHAPGQDAAIRILEQYIVDQGLTGYVLDREGEPDPGTNGWKSINYPDGYRVAENAPVIDAAVEAEKIQRLATLQADLDPALFSE